MKKILSIIVALSLVFTISITAFAEDKTPLTPEQKAAREQFMSEHSAQVAELNTLRADTVAARNKNNELAKQVKEKIKTGLKQLKDQDLTKIKEAAQKNKSIIEQAKASNEQRKAILPQFKANREELKAAIKAGDTAKVKALNDRAQELRNQAQTFNTQITDVKNQVKANRDSVKPIKDELKAARESAKAVRDKVKPLVDKAKELHKKITDEEKQKKGLWETFKTNINAKDYSAAGDTFTKIIEMKRQILADINERTKILTDILSALN